MTKPTVSTPATDPLVDRLEDIVTLMRLAFRDSLQAAGDAVRADPIDAEILRRTEGKWVGSGDLQRAVARATKGAERTIRDHLNSLLKLGLLRQHGDGPSRQYRSSGLV